MDIRGKKDEYGPVGIVREDRENRRKGEEAECIGNGVVYFIIKKKTVRAFELGL